MQKQNAITLWILWLTCCDAVQFAEEVESDHNAGTALSSEGAL